jgi:uncharacterized protein YbjT (DUF2867 family)
MNVTGRFAALVAASVMAAGVAQAKDVVLVAGATGGTGKAAVQQLVASGKYAVRALSRDPEKAKGELPAGVEVVKGDLRDAASLAAALKGVKYVISAAAARGMAKDPANTAQIVDNEGTAAFAAAAKKAGVKHFVLVSSMGTSQADTFPSEFLRPVLKAKAAGEAALRASGVPYTIVRPGGLSDDAGGKLAVAFSQGDKGTGGRIPRADVASVCIAAIGSKAAAGKTFEIVSGTGSWNAGAFDAEFAKLAADKK